MPPLVDPGFVCVQVFNLGKWKRLHLRLTRENIKVSPTLILATLLAAMTLFWSCDWKEPIVNSCRVLGKICFDILPFPVSILCLSWNMLNSTTPIFKFVPSEKKRKIWCLCNQILDRQASRGSRCTINTWSKWHCSKFYLFLLCSPLIRCLLWCISIKTFAQVYKL